MNARVTCAVLSLLVICASVHQSMWLRCWGPSVKPVLPLLFTHRLDGYVTWARTQAGQDGRSPVPHCTGGQPQYIVDGDCGIVTCYIERL